MDKKRRLNVAIVGCGLVAKARHIPALRRLGNKVRIAALCDQNRTLATETAKLFHVSRTYTSLTQLLDNERIDVVDLCVPPGVHASLAIEALNHGCHVLMEKPMALSVNDCDELI